MFLGTGTGPTVTGKGLLSSGGIIIKSGENQFHIDPGIGAIQKAAQFGVNLRENTAILLSHAHLNHSNDVNAVIDVMTVDGLDRKGVLLANQTAINGSEEHSSVITSYHKTLLERTICVNRGQKVGINEIEISALTARHNEPNSIGYRITTPNLVITYTGDTVYALDIIEQYQNTDILILNVPYKNKSKFNLCLDDAIKIIEQIKPKAALLTHFGIEMLKADPLYEVREIQKKTKIETIAAKEGLVINTGSFKRR